MSRDRDALSRVLFAALRDDPFYRRLEQACTADAMLRYYNVSIREAERWGRLGAPEKGDWGASIWAVPLALADLSRKKAEKHAALQTALGPDAAACFARIEAGMAPHEEALGLDDHWYLSILGVAPEMQGQGLGGRLLAPVLEEADAAGVASYLTTFTPRNISFYAKHGYVSAGAFAEPETGSDFHVLVRPAGG